MAAPDPRTGNIVRAMVRRIVFYTALVPFVLVACLSAGSVVRAQAVEANVGWAGLSVHRGDLWAFVKWWPGLLHLHVVVVLLWTGVTALIAYAVRPLPRLGFRGFEVGGADTAPPRGVIPVEPMPRDA